jgi:hypothetical protein
MKRGSKAFRRALDNKKVNLGYFESFKRRFQNYFRCLLKT